MKMVTGKEHKLYESAFLDHFGQDDIEKWKAYYNRALKGEYFEVEEHYFHPKSEGIQYGQITLEPLTGADDKIFAVACQSKDITHIVKHKVEANQLMDSSLDVFCTVNEQGNFVYVSAAAFNHWGYLPEELVGKPLIDMILEEDVPKTNEIIAAIFSGQEIKSFVNRYKKKDGGIAYNLWSARWDNKTKLRYAVARDCKDKIEQEEIILQSEQRFKALVQEGSDLIGILDPEGNYTYVSPTSVSVLGMKPEEFIGRNAFEFIHPDDKEIVLASLQKISTENRVIVEPFRFLNHKKEWRWIESVLTNMLDNPAVKGIVANSRDITEKIEEQRKLKLLESVITNTKDAILITEAEPFDEPGNRIIYVNDAFTKMTGYDSEDVIGKSPRILQGPNSNKEELLELGRSLRNWEPYEMTTINYKKNGEEFWMNFSVTPVSDAKGWYTHWIAIERDVTEQKKAEESILQSNERFEKVTEATKDVIWDWDIINQTFYRSKAIKRFFGKEALTSLAQKDFWKEINFHPEDVVKIKDSIYEATANPSCTRWELEYRVINEHGATLYVIDRGLIIRNNEGKAVRMVGAMTDISEQKQMTVQLDELNQSLQQYTLELERSNEELEQFAFVASHDLQEPLRMISSFMDLLQRKYGDKLDEKGHQYIHFATDGAKQMKQIILDLLDYSKAGRPTEGKEDVDMNAVLSEFKQLRRKLISEKAASINSKDLPTLNTYKAAITQILHCLLDNALKYSLEGTPPIVELAFTENEKEWEFSIKDNGIGIDPQFVDKIFIIFQRLHNKNEYEGTGIGLSIAKRHAEFLGGRIWLESLLGEGSVFYFTIPKTTPTAPYPIA